MPDREKVIKALEHHKETAVCNGCPYAEDDDTPQGNCPVYDDALALLREQEQVTRCTDCRYWDGDSGLTVRRCMMLFKKLKRKHYNLRSELAKWVEKNIGPGYVDEALEKYDKINSGIPIGGMAETVAFVDMVETVKAEAEGR